MDIYQTIISFAVTDSLGHSDHKVHSGDEGITAGARTPLM